MMTMMGLLGLVGSGERDPLLETASFAFFAFVHQKYSLLSVTVVIPCM
jgi:hypothetical protein